MNMSAHQTGRMMIKKEERPKGRSSFFGYVLNLFAKVFNLLIFHPDLHA